MVALDRPRDPAKRKLLGELAVLHHPRRSGRGSPTSRHYGNQPHPAVNSVRQCRFALHRYLEGVPMEQDASLTGDGFERSTCAV